MPVCRKCKIEMTQDNTGIYCNNTYCNMYWQDQSWLDPYEENVRKVAEEMAKDYWDNTLSKYYNDSYYDAWSKQQMPHFESAARIAVRLKSEGFKAGWFGEIQDIESAYTLAPECERQLIKRGLIPAPECGHQCTSWDSNILARTCDRCGERVEDDPSGPYAMGPGH